jgi:hypothetical protein
MHLNKIICGNNLNLEPLSMGVDMTTIDKMLVKSPFIHHRHIKSTKIPDPYKQHTAADSSTDDKR